jgi:hypothetical protein
MKQPVLATLFCLAAASACSSGAPARPPLAADAAPATAPAPSSSPDPRPDTSVPLTPSPPPGDAAPVDALPADALPPASAWPAVDDYAAAGPFPTTRDVDTGPGRAYDVFRPTELGAGNRKHPIISWANGTLYKLDQYGNLVSHWASHGFVVIAGHTNSTAGGGTHKAGIDWLLAENARPGSPYLGKLDPTRIGAAGHSQGGGATIAAGSNKPGPTGITVTLPLMPLLSFESDKGKEIVTRQAVPMLNINASMDDRDPTGAVAAQIFEGARTPLVQASYAGVHEDAMSPAMHRPTLAWFRLHLMGDEKARPLFYPAGTCGLCQDAAWKQVRHKEP